MSSDSEQLPPFKAELRRIGEMTIPHKMPTVNRPLRRLIARTVFNFYGWRIEGEIPDLPKFLAVCGPHTSNFDFPLMMCVIWGLNLDVTWMGKHTLFRWPFKRFFTWMGGYPVNRESPGGIAQQVADEFQRRDQWLVVIAPEGTRRKVNRWKTGFHRISRLGEIPMVIVRINFADRILSVPPPIMATEDMEGQIAAMRAYVDLGKGRHQTRQSELGS